MNLIGAIAMAFAKRTGRIEPSTYQLAHDIARGIMDAYRSPAEPPPKPYGADVHEVGPTALGGPPEVLRDHARLAGYTGDTCGSCGNFTLKRNGSCLSCDRCGATSGCS